VYPYFGDAHASDLVANETGTDAYNPWVEFSATLADYSAGGATNVVCMLFDS